MLVHRLRIVSFVFASLILLTGCKIGGNPPVVTVIVTLVPTNTLAKELFSVTPKYTATPIPSTTPIPSITLPPTNTDLPVTPTPRNTLTPTAAVEGAIGFTSPTVNLRSGPGSTFSSLAGLKAGTKVILVGQNTTKDWYNVRLEDGSKEGWLA